MAVHNEVGLLGEELAADYLVSCGWYIAAQRWRPQSLRTDVDIIAISPDGLYHFVEVKTRTDDSVRSLYSDYSPVTALTPAKAERMLHAAERYMQSQGLDGEIALDLIAVTIGGGGKSPEIRYYPDIAR